MAGTLSWIYNRAMRIVQISSPSTDEIALMIACLNSARKYAETHIDFELSKTRGYLSVDATDGADIDDIGGVWTGTAVGGFGDFLLKSIRRVDRWDATNSVWVPASLMSYDFYNQMSENLERRGGFDNFYTANEPTYPATTFPTRFVYLRDGGTIYSSDTSTTAEDSVIRLWVYKWMTPYEDALHSESAQDLATILAQTDFLVKHADSFLTWYAVQEFNARTANFVPRSEGSLDPAYINARVEESFNSMVKWNMDLTPIQNYLGAPE